MMLSTCLASLGHRLDFLKRLDRCFDCMIVSTSSAAPFRAISIAVALSKSITHILPPFQFGCVSKFTPTCFFVTAASRRHSYEQRSVGRGADRFGGRSRGRRPVSPRHAAARARVCRPAREGTGPDLGEPALRTRPVRIARPTAGDVRRLESADLNG